MNDVLSASVVFSEQDFKSCLKKFNINICFMGFQFLNTDSQSDYQKRDPLSYQIDSFKRQKTVFDIVGREVTDDSANLNDDPNSIFLFCFIGPSILLC
jgi:hypothetical protein